MWFAFSIGAHFFVLVYWIPIWFQAIKGVSAFKSGVMSLPLILSIVIASIFSGIGTTVIGYNTPFYYTAILLAAVGSGLLTTFQTNTGSPKWIGYQFLCGLGIGLGIQQPLTTVQTVLPLDDIPIGTAIVMFCQTFGGALFVSVAQNVFNNLLIKQITQNLSGVDPSIILRVGATNLKNAVPHDLLGSVQYSYNTALTDTWYIAVAMICVAVCGAVFIEHKSIKGIQSA
jgi:hypothetical protein